jgi:small-conductance mechanosensitive channel
MQEILDFLGANWNDIFIPVLVFIVSLIALFWLRKLTLDALIRWSKKTTWEADEVLVPSLRWPISLLGLALSIYLGIEVSSLPERWKALSMTSLWTLLVAALIIAIFSMGNTLILFFEQRYKIPSRAGLLTRSLFRVVVLAIGILAAMGIWGLPTSPLLLILAAVLLIAIIAFRDIAPNLLASFQLAATQEIKIGDFIKLETGEEGHVIAISWNITRLQALDGASIIVPNAQLVHRKLINYGRPLKKAKQVFRFNTRVYMAELTGLKARNLDELVEILQGMPDEVIHYHTHHFLEEHQYLIPELSNDFAIWVKDALGNEVLAERIASINMFELKSLADLRDKIVGIIGDYTKREAFRSVAPAGREFHFMKSMIVILPTSYIAHDLREFTEALRKISPSSLYFHIFESRLRPEIESNDFATWLDKDMEEKGLSQEVARIDPYTYTLEGLRSLLIQVTEKHIK